MIIPAIGVVVGLVVLSYAADQFVTGAARLATALRISTVVVGAVIIGFGTSAPEMLASGIAAGQGAVDLAMGNIIGSNVANLTLVLGTAALITPIATTSTTLHREAPLTVLATTVLAGIVLLVGGIGIRSGIVLATLLIASLTIIVVGARGGDPTLETEVNEFVASKYPDVRKETVRTVLALLATVGAAKVVIDSAIAIADTLGIAEGFIGLTVVAIGTSLPELATAVQAARRRNVGLIVGNILGSNLFNVGAVGATVAFVRPARFQELQILVPATLFMLAVTAAALFFLGTSRKVVRWEGIVLLIAYAAALPLIMN